MVRTTFDYDVVIVGAGASGVGMAHVLKTLGIRRFTILERHEIGASFLRWPKEMRFISPSFTGNAFGLLDLNAVTSETSPAFTLEREHPTGRQYARYLQLIVTEYELPVKTGVDVKGIRLMSSTSSEIGDAESSDQKDDRDGKRSATKAKIRNVARSKASDQRTSRLSRASLVETNYIHNGIDSSANEESESECRLDSSHEGYLIETSLGLISSRFVIWAAGEFQYPRKSELSGAEFCIHSSQISSWREAVRNLNGQSNGEITSAEDAPLPQSNHIVVIGGNESGIDAAVNLIRAGQNVTVVDRGQPWELSGSDPSKTLTPYTLERLDRALRSDRLTLAGNSRVKSVTHEGGVYTVLAKGGQWMTSFPPILATGFSGSLKLIDSHFVWKKNGYVELTEQDESTISPGLFVAGPMVRHDGVIFCFIYKFRQRFAVVANAIATRLGIDTQPLQHYRNKQMYLDDLSCCEDECAC